LAPSSPGIYVGSVTTTSKQARPGIALQLKRLRSRLPRHDREMAALFGTGRCWRCFAAESICSHVEGVEEILHADFEAPGQRPNKRRRQARLTGLISVDLPEGGADKGREFFCLKPTARLRALCAKMMIDVAGHP
jgi:hypothetical protein